MDFHISLKQNGHDASETSNLKRFITMCMAEKDRSLKIQLPAGYSGPTNDVGQELELTPEDLYLASLSGCFFTTFSVVSANSNLIYCSIEISTNGIMEVVDDVKMMARVEQRITLTVSKYVSEQFARKVMIMAEERCPLANSVKT